MQMLKNQERFNRLFEHAELHYQHSDYLSAVKWAKAAASSAWYSHAGIYAHRGTENMLQNISGSLPNRKFDWNLPSANYCSRRILHVISQAYSTGGHTRLLERWIRKSPTGDQHSIIFVDQKGTKIPNWLFEAVQYQKGSYIVVPPEYSLIEKALFLRDVSYRWADIVILHIHPDDPIPNLAFGIEGGPPIVLVNHSDHSFGLGFSIADVVLDGRTYTQEISYARRYVKKSVLLGVPLLPINSKSTKKEYKRVLGIQQDCTVMLSVGASYKYTPYQSLNFQKTILEILMRHDNLIMLVIGPSPNELVWNEVINKSDGKLKVLGVQNDLSPYYGASDIYLGSFPFGSFTAELDAALWGIPVIRPIQPLSDMMVLNKYEGMDECPKDGSEYCNLVSEYIRNPHLRKERGVIQQSSVDYRHVGQGWYEDLNNLFDQVPQTHRVGFNDNQLIIEQPSEFEFIWAEIQKKELGKELLSSLYYSYNLLQEH